MSQQDAHAVLHFVNTAQRKLQTNYIIGEMNQFKHSRDFKILTPLISMNIGISNRPRDLTNLMARNLLLDLPASCRDCILAGLKK